MNVWQHPVLSFIVMVLIGLFGGHQLGITFPGPLLPVAAFGTLAVALLFGAASAGALPAPVARALGRTPAAPGSPSTPGKPAPPAPPPLVAYDADKVGKHLREHLFGQDHVIAAVVSALGKTACIVDKTGAPARSRPILSAAFGGPPKHGKTKLTDLLAEALFGPGRVKTIRPSSFENDYHAAMATFFGDGASSPGDSRYVLLFEDVERLSPTQAASLQDILKSWLDSPVAEYRGARIPTNNVVIVCSTAENGDAMDKGIAGYLRGGSPDGPRDAGRLARKTLAASIGETAALFDVVENFVRMTDLDYLAVLTRAIEKEIRKLDYVPAQGGAVSHQLAIDLMEELGDDITPKDAAAWTERNLPMAIGAFRKGTGAKAGSPVHVHSRLTPDGTVEPVVCRPEDAPERIGAASSAAPAVSATLAPEPSPW